MERSRLVAAVGLVAGLLALSDPVAGHTGAVSSAGSATIPLWLMASTGGAVVGVSFLFATFVTDHELVASINDLGIAVPSLPSVARVLHRGGQVLSVALLATILASGLFGPVPLTRGGTVSPTSFAILVVWVGWWAGYTMTVYLVGNTWRTLNPWRALADGTRWILDAFDRSLATREYPERFGIWPSVAGLMAMVWLEVVSPVATDPRLLSAIVLAYTAATLAGALTYGDEWFEYVDPVSRVFQWYGRVAPVQRTEDGITVTLPNGALSAVEETRFDETPFVVALLWVTTFDGFVGTPAWETLVTPVLAPVPTGIAQSVAALVAYSVGMVAGYALFFGAYRWASRRAPRSADSFVTPETLQRRFLPSLLPIAAGYHLAHFVGYLLFMSPALVGILDSPLSAPIVQYVLVVPDWFTFLKLALVVAGHVLAVWVAHGIAFEVFPGRLKPIRSQYPYALVMVFYTTVSMWIVAQPFGPPPFL